MLILLREISIFGLASSMASAGISALLLLSSGREDAVGRRHSGVLYAAFALYLLSLLLVVL